ncbi:MAG: FHA domain-containing protein [Nevskiaceae bacterium]
MSTAGLHLNDAALALAIAGELHSVRPSIVHADPVDVGRFGTDATATARRTPRAVSTDHWSLLAAVDPARPSMALKLVRAELRDRLAAANVDRTSPVQLAVPASLPTAALAPLLGAVQAEGLSVGGFHDAASLTVAALAMPRTTLVLQLGQQHVAAARVAVEAGEARTRAVAVRRGSGAAALQQVWLQLASEAMVLRTRFDPLHDAASEQQLFDLLPQAWASASATGTATLELPAAGESRRIELAAEQFAQRAQAMYRDLLAVLQELRPSGAVDIVLDRSLLELPGLRLKLAELRGCRVLTVSQGLAARAASLQHAAAAADGSVTLQRGHTLWSKPLETPEELPRSLEPSAAQSPTHLLWEGRVVSLPRGRRIEVGREVDGAGVRVGEGVAGVSRLHCSLLRDERGVTLQDHSRYGTWLNDQRVPGRVNVLAGDRMRLGDPGIEFGFVAVGEADGSPQG